jgi:hypothetical protein
MFYCGLATAEEMDTFRYLVVVTKAVVRHLPPSTVFLEFSVVYSEVTVLCFATEEKIKQN